MIGCEGTEGGGEQRCDLLQRFGRTQSGASVIPRGAQRREPRLAVLLDDLRRCLRQLRGLVAHASVLFELIVRTVEELLLLLPSDKEKR